MNYIEVNNLEYFDITLQKEFDVNVPFTRESWHGRMRACRGVGASMSPENIRKWNTEHMNMLEENAPENSPNLWEDVKYKDGYRVIPEAIPSTDPFSKGDCGWWKEVLYKSIFDGANVWTPEQLASAWEVVENA